MVEDMFRALFDDEYILDMYVNAERKEAAKETATLLIRKGKMSLEDIAVCVTNLSMDELKELEAEVMQRLKCA